MSFYQGKRVLVTGGDGFIGSFVVERLLKQGAKVRVAGRTHPPKFLGHVAKDIEFVKADLLHQEDAMKVCKEQEAVFQLAARVAGIGYNLQHSGTMMTENSIMSMLMLDAARASNVERYQYISSTCVYRREATVPTPEEEGMLGDPEPSNFGYGWAKRVGELQAKMFAKEFGMKISVVRPMNAYGPRDDFSYEMSHVVPALIRKVFDAKDEVVVWGSGSQTRAFVYVDDVARGMLMALEKYPVPDPVNIGTSEEVTIRELITEIVALSGRSDLKIRFDTTKPEGQPRKAAEASKAERLVGFKSEVPLREGLKRTIQWFSQNKAQIAPTTA